MNVYKEFTKHVIKRRKEKGVSQIQIARMIGVTQSTMSRIENGEVQPLFHNAIALSKVLAIDLNTLKQFVRTSEK